LAKKDAKLQDWFRYSRVDLRMAKALFEKNDAEMWRGVAFNCQQSAEKAIKGFLTYKKISFQTTHDIGSLATKILVSNPELEPLLKRASTLTKYAIMYRYPDAVQEELTKVHVEDAIDCAYKVLDKMSALIPFDSLFEV
jgi:HEPN domain-containing protein